MAKIEHPDVPGLQPSPAYSHTVVATGGRTVFIAGQVALDEQGKLVGACDLAGQARQVMENLGRALAAAGAGFRDVVKITTFVVDYTPDKRAVIGDVRSPYFAGGKPPASTLVGVSALAVPEWLIEIEAIAVVG